MHTCIDYSLGFLFMSLLHATFHINSLCLLVLFLFYLHSINKSFT